MFNKLEQMGLVCFTVVSLQVVHAILKVYSINSLCPTNLQKMGDWAVVTGSTDDIGRAFARKLAELGMNVILIGSKMDQLVALGADIKAQYKVQVTLIVADFYDPSDEAYHNIRKQMYGHEVGCLINNVAVSYPHPDYFLKLPHGDEIFMNMINCNVLAVTNITMMLLPYMVMRGRGVIVNISSTAATIPSPLLTVYGATKAYVKKFTKDLQIEYRDRRIIVQCLMPGYVATWLSPTPKRYVDSAVDTIGVLDVTVGYIPHSMLVYLMKSLESIAPTFVLWVIHQTLKWIRQRAIERNIKQTIVL